MTQTSRGHTQRHLQKLLADRGLAPRSSLGQCFLVDLNLLDVLVQAADLTERDFVLEVGTGTGSLTQRLSDRAQVVLSVEIDPGLYALAFESLRGRSNVRLIQGDILKRKNALNPAVMEAIEAMESGLAGNVYKVVANLPYVVATPVISLLLSSNRPWERLVITIQKELAERLVARPSTKDYGSLSVLAQSLADVEIIRELPPSAFWPRPQVWSAFVRIIPDPRRRAAIRDLPSFVRFARGVMVHRRKVLRTAMHSMMRSVTKPDIDEFLAKLAVDPQVRAESLPVTEFVRIANELPPPWLED